MADSTLVDIFDARNELLEDASGCFLVQALVLHDVVKELAVDTVLHD